MVRSHRAQLALPSVALRPVPDRAQHAALEAEPTRSWQATA